jgi:hypothetical protein
MIVVYRPGSLSEVLASNKSDGTSADATIVVTDRYYQARSRARE